MAPGRASLWSLRHSTPYRLGVAELRAIACISASDHRFGHPIIAPRRKSSSHLHRPWRAISPRARYANCLICLFYSAARPCRTLRLLSCHRSVDPLRLADPARIFAKMRSDKNATKHHGSRSRACLLHWVYRVFADRMYVMFARSTEPGTQELLPLCSLFADRMPEGDEQTGLARTWQCRPVLRRADMAISTRMDPSQTKSRLT
jgi:hypothetical protein